MSKIDHWLYNSDVSRIAGGSGPQSQSAHFFFCSFVIFGGQCGSQASKSACILGIPQLFQAVLGTHLIKQGGDIGNQSNSLISSSVSTQCSHSKQEALGLSPDLSLSIVKNSSEFTS